MNWHYTYTADLWPSFFTLIFWVALGIYAWRRRRMPGALPFIVACWLAKRNLFLLSLPCFLALGLILTNERTYLIWHSFEFQGTFRPRFGLGSWLFSIYGLGISER